jgi:hypothetical protein
MPLLALAFAALAAFYLYVYLRVVVHTRYHNGQRLYLPFEPRSPESLPPAVWRQFTEVVPGLERLGFVVTDYVHHAGMPDEEEGRNDVYAALLRNDESGDSAAVTQIFSQFRQASGKLAYVGFHTELEGGDSVTTVNAAQVPAYSQNPRRPVFRFPEVADARLLFSAHRGLVGRRAPGRRGTLPAPGLEVPFMCESEAKAQLHQVECGNLYFDDARQMCIPTWKGALLMTGRQMWVIRPLLLALLRLRARLTLRSLGLSRG